MTFRYEAEERWRGTNQRKGSADKQIDRLEEAEGLLVVCGLLFFFLSVCDKMFHLSDVNGHLYATELISLEPLTQTRGREPV